MGITKTDFFTSKQNQLANLAKALANPARIAIVEYLLKVDSCICGDIVEELPIAQSTVSQHLKELKQAGLIKGNIDGASICYCVDTEQLQNAKDILNQLLSTIILTPTTCC
jgi:DNA-binding transcriptional ArsR family regulator